jgi:sugar fermentation stimulation protein A
MFEFMLPNTKVYLIPRAHKHRKTKYDLTIIEYKTNLVSIDSRIPNYLLREAIEQQKLPEFEGYSVESTEPKFQNSRFDLKLNNIRNTILLEAKSCTLVENQIAFFPDAPTKRGTRHINSLIKALDQGRAVVCFIIQRKDAKEWRPNKKMDPDFTYAINQAVKKGVEAYAYTCKITLNDICIHKRVPINLE